ncbi:MAG: prepilin-type N-terminal cleavage/methylation domain-containing protein [Fimbriimonas sp.]
MRSRGVTLLELLVVVTMIGLITAGVFRAYSSGLGFEQGLTARRQAMSDQVAFEDQLRSLIQRAMLSADATNPNTYFVGAAGLGENAQGGSESTDLVFVVAGQRLPTALIENGSDFETNNEQFGPQGGLAEVHLSTTAVGDAGSRQGLFMRQQRPSDGDPSQGGSERLFDSTIDSVRFEFWDGASWLASWDTRSMTPPRLPAAVRITYTRAGDSTERPLVVQLPNSDVTKDNPISTGGATQ